MAEGYGRVGRCAMCGETKALIAGHFSEESESHPGHEWLICKDCSGLRFLCEFCKEQTTSLSYERHLIQKHTKEEMAKKISEDMAKKLNV